MASNNGQPNMPASFLHPAALTGTGLNSGANVPVPALAPALPVHVLPWPDLPAPLPFIPNTPTLPTPSSPTANAPAPLAILHAIAHQPGLPSQSSTSAASTAGLPMAATSATILSSHIPSSSSNTTSVALNSGSSSSRSDTDYRNGLGHLEDPRTAEEGSIHDPDAIHLSPLSVLLISIASSCTLGKDGMCVASHRKYPHPDSGYEYLIESFPSYKASAQRVHNWVLAWFRSHDFLDYDNGVHQFLENFKLTGLDIRLMTDKAIVFYFFEVLNRRGIKSFEPLYDVVFLDNLVGLILWIRTTEEDTKVKVWLEKDFDESGLKEIRKTHRYSNFEMVIEALKSSSFGLGNDTWRLKSDYEVKTISILGVRYAMELIESEDEMMEPSSDMEDEDWETTDEEISDDEFDGTKSSRKGKGKSSSYKRKEKPNRYKGKEKAREMEVIEEVDGEV